MITIGTAYFLAAVTASCIFIVAGWRSKGARRPAVAQPECGVPADPLWGAAETHFDALPEGASPGGASPNGTSSGDISRDRISPGDTAKGTADVGAAIRLALKRLVPLMASQSVQAEVATQPGLAARMSGAPLTDLLEEMLTAAIQGAPAGRLLLTATRHGNHIDVGITDDMPNADPTVRRGSVRGLAARIAARGGTLDVSVRPTEGTTMTLRLAAAGEPPPMAGLDPFDLEAALIGSSSEFSRSR